jgi:hypothetical protein
LLVGFMGCVLVLEVFRGFLLFYVCGWPCDSGGRDKFGQRVWSRLKGGQNAYRFV